MELGRPRDLLLIPLVLWLLCGLLYPPAVQVPLFLLLGWGGYLRRTLPQVQLYGPGVATFVICLVALIFSLHRFLAWIRLHGVHKDAAVATWPWRWTLSIVGAVILMFVAGIAAIGVVHQTAWLFTTREPFLQGGLRAAATRVLSQNRLKEVAYALENYYELHGKYCPPAIYGKNGKPLLSWRVAILPYLDPDLFKQFRVDESWDSPHNLSLLTRMPTVYNFPGQDEEARQGLTHYLVFVGEGAAFEVGRGMQKAKDFPDGPSETILVIESREAVPWTKPQELEFKAVGPLPELGLEYQEGINMIMAAGFAQFMEHPIPETVLRAAITRNGKENSLEVKLPP